MDKPKVRRGRKPKLRLVATNGAEITEGAASPGGDHFSPGGGEDRSKPGKRRSPVLPNGLTEKQERFAVAVAEGRPYSDAYRIAFDASRMADATVWARASEMAANGKVRARIEELQAEKERFALHDRRRALAWALERLQREAEGAETDGARVQAVALVMRHHALLTDRLEAEHTDNRTAAELEAELRDKLASLLRKAG